MNTRPLCHALTAAILTVAISGCASSRSGASRVGSTRSQQRIQLDGQFTDWPGNAAALADANWLYFHATVEDSSAPLQAAPETLAIWLDADANKATGTVMPGSAGAGMGVDAVIEFSPADAQNAGKLLRGTAVVGMDSAGGKVTLSNAQIGLASLPTYAASGYEMRISRHCDAAAAPGLAQALAASGRARVMFVLKDASGKVLGWSDPEIFTKPTVSASAPATDDTVPPKAPGTIRVVSYNVLKSKLGAEPQTFARLFQVLDADVILAQEWNADPATATAWFTAIVTGSHPWNARAAAGDVVIVSPHPIDPLGPDALTLEPASGGGEANPAVRFVAGLVTTPAGQIAVGSLHLKCCGTAGSVEDKTRSAQAAAINSAMKSALDQSKPPIRLFAGDFNLVGSRAPLDTFCAGLDSDGSELAVAEPMVLGDAAQYTWVDAASEFPPGRLDFAVYSDATAQVVQAFIVDTRKFSPRALARMGLDAGDTAASDHLPVVVDLKPR